MAIKSALFLAPLALMVACASDVSTGDGPGSPNNPNDPTNPDSPTAKIAGDYEVTSKFDLSNSPDIPSIVSDALGPLSGISDDPAGAILDIIKASAELDGVPDFIIDVLAQGMNKYIEGRLDSKGAKELLEATEMITAMLTDFEVISTLTVGTADAANNANAEHSLKAIAFPKDGKRTVINTPDIVNTISIARDISVSVDIVGSKGTIDIGGHAFKLPLGDFAVQGYHTLLKERFGKDDLGDILGQAINCGDLAKEVGDIKLGEFVVLKEDKVGTLCEKGLEQVGAKLDDKIRDIEFAKLHWVGGEGTVSMGSSGISGMTGSWQTSLNINESDSEDGFALPSKFEAKRM